MLKVSRTKIVFTVKSKCSKMSPCSVGGVETWRKKKFEASLMFGLKIKKLREGLGLGSCVFVRSLKEKTGCKITAAYMTRIELYGAIPHPRVVVKFAEFFKIDEDILFGIIKDIKLADAIARIKTKYDNKKLT